jgi:hypothetical protein
MPPKIRQKEKGGERKKEEQDAILIEQVSQKKVS